MGSKNNTNMRSTVSEGVKSQLLESEPGSKPWSTVLWWCSVLVNLSVTPILHLLNRNDAQQFKIVKG